MPAAAAIAIGCPQHVLSWAVSVVSAPHTCLCWHAQVAELSRALQHPMALLLALKPQLTGLRQTHIMASPCQMVVMGLLKRQMQQQHNFLQAAAAVSGQPVAA